MIMIEFVPLFVDEQVKTQRLEGEVKDLKFDPESPT
jgi:hypothetical protein